MWMVIFQQVCSLSGLWLYRCLNVRPEFVPFDRRKLESSPNNLSVNFPWCRCPLPQTPWWNICSRQMPFGASPNSARRPVCCTLCSILALSLWWASASTRSVLPCSWPRWAASTLFWRRSAKASQLISTWEPCCLLPRDQKSRTFEFCLLQAPVTCPSATCWLLK